MLLLDGIDWSTCSDQKLPTSKLLDGALEARIQSTGIIISRAVTVCAAVQQFLTAFEVHTVDPKGDNCDTQPLLLRLQICEQREIVQMMQNVCVVCRTSDLTP